MSEAFYYYCKTCQKAVPIAIGVCDGCRKHFRKETAYRMEQIEQFQKEDRERIREDTASKEAAQAAGSSDLQTASESALLKCPICGKSYDEKHTVCDDCGMALMMVYEPIEVPEETATIHMELIFGNVIEQPTWEVAVKRFLDNKAYAVDAPLVINHEIMPVGRRYFVENNVFASDKTVSNALLKRISRDNGFFIVENGELFIQYDRTNLHGKDKEKTCIKVNGVILANNERKKLIAHDIITLGNKRQSDMDYCVEMEVLRRGGEFEGSHAAIADISKNINLLLESAQRSEEMHKQTYEQVKETAENVRKLSDLSISRFESLEQFVAAAENYEKNLQGGKLTREEYLDKFLGTYPRKQELLSSLTEAQEQYLYYAAFYETMALQQEDESMDYSAAFIYLGKLLENFAHQTLIPLIQKYAPARWAELNVGSATGGNTASHGGNNNNFRRQDISLGHITRSFVKWENNRKMCRDDILVPMARDYVGITHGPVDREVLRQIRKSFMDCDKARSYRNDAAHSSLEAILADELQTITYENYRDAKRNVIESGFLINIYSYYAKTCKEG